MFWCSLGALLLVRLLVMIATPVFDPSEARYAAISANMARTGDFLVPHLTHKGVYGTFDGKPPLVFQAGGVLCRLLGVNEFAVRLFPFLSALLLLFILYHTARKLYGRGTASLAVGICASSVALYATAGIAMTDMSLSCCVSGALLLYARLRQVRHHAPFLGISALLACGMLVKGPVALALFGLPVLADAMLNRNWQLLLDRRWLPGAVLFLVLAAPWFILMQEKNPDFLRYFFINENLLRFLVHNYGDKYGAGRETFRGMALVWLFVVSLPWTLVPLFTLRRHHMSNVRHISQNFPALATIVITGFWCLTSRVPLTYLLPTVPLAALWIATDCRHRPLLWKLLPYSAALAMLVVIGTLLYAQNFTKKMPGPDARPRTHGLHYSHEFYHGLWGIGAPSCKNGDAR